MQSQILSSMEISSNTVSRNFSNFFNAIPMIKWIKFPHWKSEVYSKLNEKRSYVLQPRRA